MRVLELFKGTGSVSTYCQNNNIECLSLDWDKKFNPDICCDIQEFDYKKYDKGHFDIVFASPECKMYSVAQNGQIGRRWSSRSHLELERRKHDKLMRRTLEVIKYLEPKYYFVENPRYSNIWQVDETKLHDCVLVDYFRFRFDYKNMRASAPNS